jgi:DEAD/DEAH box helicase domain-containing protein
LNSEEFPIQEQLSLPPRDERTRPGPDRYLIGPVGTWLRNGRARDVRLWNHQSLALEADAAGDDVTLATDTASGKSLVFQAIALAEFSRDPEVRFAVFYPMKALSNDQYLSWRAAAAAAGMPETTVGLLHVSGSASRDWPWESHTARARVGSPGASV